MGSSVSLNIGAHTDNLHGTPLEAMARVRALSDGRYENPDDMPTHGGRRYFDAGLCAHVELDTGQTVLLTSKRDENTSLVQHFHIGIRPETFAVIVTKGVISPQAAYAAVAANGKEGFLFANTAGATTQDLTALPFERRRKPLFPFETDCVWQEGDERAQAHL